VSYTKQISPTVRNLNDISCAGKNNCHAVGNHGVIVARRG
jgi:hypothetical protein